MKHLCEACGSTNVFVSIGGIMLCRQCEPEINAEIEKLRQQSKPVNVLHIARRRFKAKFSGGDYLLRDVPAELLTKLKHHAIDNNGSVRDVILAAIIAYLD